MAIRLLVGLGNPEVRYRDTRHNLGASLVARVVPDAVFRFEAKFHAYYYQYGDTLLARPSVAMNHSGRTLLAVANYYRISPEEILVAHDELDLEAGIARFKHGGGAGGHNGIADIVRTLGDANFYRLRLGIGHPGESERVNPFVLSKATAAERTLHESAIERALDVLPLVFKGSWELAMTKLHTKNA